MALCTWHINLAKTLQAEAFLKTCGSCGNIAVSAGGFHFRRTSSKWHFFSEAAHFPFGFQKLGFVSNFTGALETFQVPSSCFTRILVPSKVPSFDTCPFWSRVQCHRCASDICSAPVAVEKGISQQRASASDWLVWHDLYRWDGRMASFRVIRRVTSPAKYRGIMWILWPFEMDMAWVIPKISWLKRCPQCRFE